MASETRYGPLEVEQMAFDSMLDEMMEEHAGQFVVIKGGQPVGFYPSFADAHKAALGQFGLDGGFLVSEVKKRGPEPVSISWSTGVMFG